MTGVASATIPASPAILKRATNRPSVSQPYFPSRLREDAPYPKVRVFDRARGAVSMLVWRVAARKRL